MSDATWYGGREQARQLREALRTAALQVQKFGSLVREFERTMDRIRDRQTIPSRRVAEAQTAPRWAEVRRVFLQTEKTLADWLATYY